MKRCMNSSLWWALGLVMTVTTAAPRGVWAEDVKLTELANGFQVLTMEDTRFPLVALRLYVHAGSSYEHPEEAGISHLLEHMVFKGTAERGPGKVADDIEGAGGYLNAATSFDYTVYQVDLPSEYWALGIDVLQDMIFGATIDPAELDQERKVVLSELERGEDSPDRVLFQQLQPLLWPDSSYARPIIGYRDTLRKIDRQQVLDYINRLYQPRKMLLVVSGNIDTDRVVEEAKKRFGWLKNTRASQPLENVKLPRPGEGEPLFAIERGAWNKAYVTAAFPAPENGAPLEPATEVLAQLLGGDETALLPRTLKYEMQLVDEISVSATILERAGMFGIRAEMDADKVETYISSLSDLLAELDVSRFTDQELQRAKLNLEDSLFQAMETLGGLASKLGYFQFLESGLDAEERYLFSIRETDREQLAKVASGLLRPEFLRVSMLLPEGHELTEEEARSAVLSAWPVKPAPEAALPTPGVDLHISDIDLGQGRRLVLLPDETLPYVAVTMRWEGGDALLDHSEQGLAELTASSLTRGAGKLDAPAVQDFLADRAARVSAAAGRDAMTLQAKFLTRYTSDMLPLLTDIIRAPRFDDTEIERVKREQKAEIVSREDQPMGKAYRHLFPFLFPGSHYGYFHLGQPEGVDGYSAQDVARFWEKQRGMPWVMAVSGRFDEEMVSAFARNLAGGDALPPLSTEKIVWNATRDLTLPMEERSQLHLLLLFETPTIDDVSAPGLALLRTILGGQGGILFQELRDKRGLGYAVSAMLWQTRNAGFLALYIGVSPDKEEQAMEGFKTVLTRLHEQPLSEMELERAKNLMLGSYHRGRQSLLSRSDEAAEAAIQGFDLDFEEKLIEKAQNLTAEDMQELAGRILQWNRAYTLKVVPGGPQP